MSLKNGRQGSIQITTADSGFNRDLYIQPWPPIEINPLPTNGNGNGGEWGGIGVAIGGIGAYIDMRAPGEDKDCGDDYENTSSRCEGELSICLAAAVGTFSACAKICGHLVVPKAVGTCIALCLGIYLTSLAICWVLYDQCKRSLSNKTQYNIDGGTIKNEYW